MLHKLSLTLCIFLILGLLVLPSVSSSEATVSIPFVEKAVQDFTSDEGEELEKDEPYHVINVARSSNGAVAIPSSTIDNRWPAASVINGDRAGIGWATGNGGWNDATQGTFPDWIEIQFDDEKLISQVDVYTLQDNYTTPVEPTADLTFSQYGIKDFYVQCWNSTAHAWETLGGKANNDRVWTQFTFADVVTNRIRVIVTSAMPHSLGYTRIVEIEAWGRDPDKALPATLGPCGRNRNELDPCELLTNLYTAINGDVRVNFVNPTQSNPNPDNSLANWFPGWETRLDPGFARMQDRPGGPPHQYGSQNWGPMAQAVALFDNGTTSGEADWWNTYLDCQLGNNCSIPGDSDPEMLKYLKGAELFSNTYDADVVTSVLAVRYWAHKELDKPNSQAKAREILDKSRAYLRRNWALYSLAAGRGPARKLFNRYTTDGFVCQNNYSGPFIAMAGMRSTPIHTCQDDRGPLLASALGWTLSTGWNGSDHLKRVSNFIAGQPRSSLYPNENNFALNDSEQAMLRNIINTGGWPYSSDPNTLLTVQIIFNNLLTNLRTATPYHFLAWINGNRQMRVTIMEGNVNYNTAPTYSVKYEFDSTGANVANNRATILFPFSNVSHVPDTNNPAIPDLYGQSIPLRDDLWERYGFANGPYCRNVASYNPWRFGIMLGKAVFINSRTVEAQSDSNPNGGSCEHERVKLPEGPNPAYRSRPIKETLTIPSKDLVQDAGWRLLYHITLNKDAPPTLRLHR